MEESHTVIIASLYACGLRSIPVHGPPLSAGEALSFLGGWRESCLKLSSWDLIPAAAIEAPGPPPAGSLVLSRSRSGELRPASRATRSLALKAFYRGGARLPAPSPADDGLSTVVTWISRHGLRPASRTTLAGGLALVASWLEGVQGSSSNFWDREVNILQLEETERQDHHCTPDRARAATRPGNGGGVHLMDVLRALALLEGDPPAEGTQVTLWLGERPVACSSFWSRVDPALPARARALMAPLGPWGVSLAPVRLRPGAEHREKTAEELAQVEAEGDPLRLLAYLMK